MNFFIFIFTSFFYSTCSFFNRITLRTEKLLLSTNSKWWLRWPMLNIERSDEREKSINKTFNIERERLEALRENIQQKLATSLRRSLIFSYHIYLFLNLTLKIINKQSEIIFYPPNNSLQLMVAWLMKNEWKVRTWMRWEATTFKNKKKKISFLFRWHWVMLQLLSLAQINEYQKTIKFIIFLFLTLFFPLFSLSNILHTSWYVHLMMIINFYKGINSTIKYKKFKGKKLLRIQFEDFHGK